MRSAKLEENSMEPFNGTKAPRWPLDWMEVTGVVLWTVVIFGACVG